MAAEPSSSKKRKSSECTFEEEKESRPPIKRQRTDVAEDAESPPTEKKRVGPKRKVALLVSYLGSNYHGSDLGDTSNPLPTISGTLFEAIKSIGAVSTFNTEGDWRKKTSFEASSRTDKGVHAAAATFSLKMVNLFENKEDEQRTAQMSVDELCAHSRWDQMTVALNEVLPPDIRVQGIQRTSKRFSPRFGAGSRVYHYLCPSYLFDAAFKAADCEHLEWKYCDKSLRKMGAISDDAKCKDTTNGIWNEKDARSKYRIGKELVEKLQAMLDRYVGTKNYHNFSRGMLPDQAQAMRYLMSMKVLNASLVLNEMEFVLIELHGASFIYHQIRKMIGFVVAMMRHSVWSVDGKLVSDEESLWQMAFSKDHKMAIPLAPSEGLYLKEVRYDLIYNSKAPEERRICSDIWTEGIESFISGQILPNIVKHEVNAEQPRNGHRFAYWLYELDHEFTYEAVQWTDELKRELKDKGHKLPSVGGRRESRDERQQRLTALHQKGTKQCAKTAEPAIE